jgi:hypothetical protein
MKRKSRDDTFPFKRIESQSPTFSKKKEGKRKRTYSFSPTQTSEKKKSSQHFTHIGKGRKEFPFKK